VTGPSTLIYRRLPGSARQRRLLSSLAIPVTVQPLTASLVQVVYQYAPIGDYEDLGHGAKRFQCLICSLKLREEASMIYHIYYHHRPAIGMASLAVASIGYVRTNERRARMPWRLSAPEVQL